MQPVKKIQQLLDSHDARPMGRFGQCFLIDLNYMSKVLEIAAVKPQQTILEVGPGTGSLTEELLKQSSKVVAAEIDRKFCGILRELFGGCDNFTLIEGDALAGKHAIAPEILRAVSPTCSLVANLPYNAATSLVIDALIESCRALHAPQEHVTFESLTFTVQKEVADRLAAVTGDDYGVVSVIVALTSDITLGPVIPPSAFWPRPKIDSRIVRIDFNPRKAVKIKSLSTLRELLHMGFTQRRKHLLAAAKSKNAPFPPQRLAEAMQQLDISQTTRSTEASPENYLDLSNMLAD